ncbi:MAG: lactate racemase domain-containing protein [Promethearchaeota archaeon]
MALPDVAAAVESALDRLDLGRVVKPGDSVAVTAGSRGIKGIVEVLKGVVEYLRRVLGAKPFLFAAMGSHGGGTPEGQLAVLSALGIDERSVGCPVRATSETLLAGDGRGANEFGRGAPVDALAAAADHVLVVNRVKSHTKYDAGPGGVESGLCKMCLVGVGKAAGAALYHRLADRHSWTMVVDAFLPLVLEGLPVRGGLALVQDARGNLARVEGLLPGEFRRIEPRLLELAKRLTPDLPFDDVDLLVVDQIGKDVSGTGMDTNVIGRGKVGSSEKVRVRRIFARGLSGASEGNANGIGFADFTTREVLASVDWRATYLNARSAGRTESCKAPMALGSDSEVLEAALELAGLGAEGCGGGDPSEFRLLWIRDTSTLDRFVASEAFFEEARDREDVHLVIEPRRLEFNARGRLVNPAGDWSRWPVH